jgi:hypothetical protein
MIRPLTLVCLMLAGGSGYYLYQVKEKVAHSEKDLRDVIRQTNGAMERTAVLQAEYALLTEPERLRRMVERNLPLQPMQASQFTRAPDAEKRLPAVIAFAGPPQYSFGSGSGGSTSATVSSPAADVPHDQQSPQRSPSVNPTATAARPSESAPSNEQRPSPPNSLPSSTPPSSGPAIRQTPQGAVAVARTSPPLSPPQNTVVVRPRGEGGAAVSSVRTSIPAVSPSPGATAPHVVASVEPHTVSALAGNGGAGLAPPIPFSQAQRPRQ